MLEKMASHRGRETIVRTLGILIGSQHPLDGLSSLRALTARRHERKSTTIGRHDCSGVLTFPRGFRAVGDRVKRGHVSANDPRKMETFGGYQPQIARSEFRAKASSSPMRCFSPSSGAPKTSCLNSSQSRFLFCWFVARTNACR